MLGTGGRKSRNKVIVGEPAVGSLTDYNRHIIFVFKYILYLFGIIYRLISKVAEPLEHPASKNEI